jgi:hypothetical protein
LFAAPSLADPRPRWPWAALVPPVDTAIKRVQRTKAHEDGCVSLVHEGDGAQKSGEQRERKKKTEKENGQCRTTRLVLILRTDGGSALATHQRHMWHSHVRRAAGAARALPHNNGLQRDPPWLLPPSFWRTKKKASDSEK